MKLSYVQIRCDCSCSWNGSWGCQMCCRSFITFGNMMQWGAVITGKFSPTFLQKTPNTLPITFCVKLLIYILPQSLQYCGQYHAMLDRIIMTPDFIRLPSFYKDVAAWLINIQTFLMIKRMALWRFEGCMYMQNMVQIILTMLLRYLQYWQWSPLSISKLTSIWSTT